MFIITQRNNIRLLKGFVKYKTAQLEKHLSMIEKDLKKYELQYNFPSRKFYKQYKTGELGDGYDFRVWAEVYEKYMKFKEQLEKICGEGVH